MVRKKKLNHMQDCNQWETKARQEVEEHFYTPLLPSLSLQVQFLKLLKVTEARFSWFFPHWGRGTSGSKPSPSRSLHSRFPPLYILASFPWTPFRSRNSKHCCQIIHYFFPFEELLLLPFPPMTHIPLPPSILTDFPPVLPHTLRLACKCIFKRM